MKITVTYDVMKATARRTGPCTKCGKKTTRTRTFECTVNPFNTDLFGRPKSPADVQRDVAAKAKAWRPEPAHFDHLVDCR